jgi:3-oxoacyl-[acyl-carrier protein] reductase
MEYSGLVAFVTGAANGIGEATARLLADRGAAVALADIDPKVTKVAASIGSDALALLCDVRQAQSVANALDATMARFGRIDMVANIAGVFPSAPVGGTDDALFAEVLETNLTGTFRVCRAAQPFLARQGGAIVNIASGAAFRALPDFSAYSASKGGVVALSRVLAAEFAPSIRVNTIAPGATATAIVLARAAERGGDPPGLPNIPLGRMAKPEEIADCIAFLLSARARMITGQVLPVNGGSLMN